MVALRSLGRRARLVPLMAALTFSACKGKAPSQKQIAGAAPSASQAQSPAPSASSSIHKPIINQVIPKPLPAPSASTRSNQGKFKAVLGETTMPLVRIGNAEPSPFCGGTQNPARTKNSTCFAIELGIRELPEGQIRFGIKHDKNSLISCQPYESRGWATLGSHSLECLIDKSYAKHFNKPSGKNFVVGFTLQAWKTNKVGLIPDDRKDALLAQQAFSFTLDRIKPDVWTPPGPPRRR